MTYEKKTSNLTDESATISLTFDSIYIKNYSKEIEKQYSGMLNDGSYGLVDDLKIKLDGNALYGITDYAAETNYKGSANFVDADGSG